MDVTKSINKTILSMSGSGSSMATNLSATKSLNFAKDSNSLLNATVETVTAVPYTLNFQDSVGLFGAENIFVKVQLRIISATTAFANIDIPENTYYPVWTFDETETINTYETGEFIFGIDNDIVNTYEPARISNDLSPYAKPYVRIDLKNIKTGNKYIDSWFDVRIYTDNRIEYPYDTIYLGVNDCFYIGFHARNTRRLPYNVKVDIGNEYLDFYDLTPEQKRLTVQQ